MDPFSISVGALTCAQVLKELSKRIYVFVDAAKEIDISVKNLQLQADGLARVLKSLSEALKKPEVQRFSQSHQSTWDDLGVSIEECKSVVEALDEKLKGLKAPSGNVMKQAWRQFKFDMKQEELDRYLNAMRTQSANIQLALGTVHLLVSVDSSDQSMPMWMEKVDKMLLAIFDRLNPNQPNKHLPGDKSLDSITLNETTVRLKDRASSVMSSASTAAGSTWSGASASGRASNEPAFETVELVKNESDPKYPESTTGSETGVELSKAKKSHIMEWISREDLGDIEEEESSTTLSRQDSNVLTQSSETFVNAEVNVPEIVYDESSDDDHEYEAAKYMFDEADTLYSQKEYSQAATMILGGMDQSMQLSVKKKQLLGLVNQQLKYAICCVLNNDLNEAEKKFTELLNVPPSNSANVAVVLHAMHGLAKINLRRRNIRTALQHCQQAVKGRGKTKTIGKSHDDYKRSLRLLSLIFWAKGDKVKARAYANQLDGDFRVTVIQFDQILCSEYGFDMPAANETELPTPGSDRPLSPGSDRPISPESESERRLSESLTLTRELTSSTEQGSVADQTSYLHTEASNSALPPISEFRDLPDRSKELDEPTTSREALQEPSPSSKYNKESSGTPPKESSSAGKSLENIEDLAVATKAPVADDPSNLLGQIHDSASSETTATLARLLDAWQPHDDPKFQSTISAALVNAALSDKLDNCTALLNAGARINGTNQQGQSPLICAAIMGNVNTCALLLAKGANPNLRDMNGETAARWLVEKSNGGSEAKSKALSILKLLKFHNADPFITDNKGCTVFEQAKDASVSQFLHEWSCEAYGSWPGPPQPESQEQAKSPDSSNGSATLETSKAAKGSVFAIERKPLTAPTSEVQSPTGTKSDPSKIEQSRGAERSKGSHLNLYGQSAANHNSAKPESPKQEKHKHRKESSLTGVLGSVGSVLSSFAASKTAGKR